MVFKTQLLLIVICFSTRNFGYCPVISLTSNKDFLLLFTLKIIVKLLISKELVQDLIIRGGSTIVWWLNFLVLYCGSQTILNTDSPTNTNVKSGLYVTNKIYITNHERVSDKPTQAILLFWLYCFTHLSSLIVALFVEIIFSNAEFGDALVIASAGLSSPQIHLISSISRPS